MEPLQAIGNTCGYDEPLKQHIVCAPFYFARAKKQIIPNHDEGGWEFLEFEAREMPYDVRHRLEKRGQYYVDHTGDPYVYSEICPLCGGELPPVELRERPLLPRGDATNDGA